MSIMGSGSSPKHGIGVSVGGGGGGMFELPISHISLFSTPSINTIHTFFFFLRWRGKSGGIRFRPCCSAGRGRFGIESDTRASGNQVNHHVIYTIAAKISEFFFGFRLV